MSTKTTKRRPNMHRITEDMKQWSAMLENELRSWPHVTTRPMFGLLGYYRKKTIFAALPVTRAIGAPNSIIFKFKSMPPDLSQRVDRDGRCRSAPKCAPRDGSLSRSIRRRIFEMRCCGWERLTS